MLRRSIKYMMMCILVCPLIIWAADRAESRLITVTGDADVKVVPDEVILTLGVETWNEDLDVAKKDNDERIKKTLSMTKKFDILPKHVQTDYISIEPTYKSNVDERIIIGYFVRKTIVITLRDIFKFEDVLSSALKSGVNKVQGIQFRTTELRKHRDRARALAIKAAKEKAVALATELGQKVGRPRSINEQSAGWWDSYGYGWGSRWQYGMAQNVVQNVGEGAGSEEGTIAPGQIRVNARVSVSFELE